ncbi:hypothetical protein VPH35_133248 [Triticum aestivum]
MARAFVRSISFPLSPSRSPKARAPSSSYHGRSVSLPCRSHPILAHLHTHIRAVRAWSQQGLAALVSSVAAGLAHVDALHAALGDLLDLPEAQDALSGAGGSVDCLLDSFLRLADAHGCFQETVVALKQDVAEALTAVRRGDGARLASAVRTQRRAGKELAGLAAAARECAVTIAAEYPRRRPRQRCGGRGDRAAHGVCSGHGVGICRAVRGRGGYVRVRGGGVVLMQGHGGAGVPGEEEQKELVGAGVWGGGDGGGGRGGEA